ncbi:MAG: carbonic anhydrase, partial [Thermotogota bacterium]|nr:carbonic anhydrase [Thermotogota bacterium]
MIHQSVVTDFCQKEYLPEVDSSAFIHPVAAVIGHVFIGKRVMVAPFASVRGDEGQPIFVGDESNVQDGVILHALETEHNGHPIEANQV